MSDGPSAGASRTRCAECGWPLYPGQPVVTVADEQSVHEWCRDGVPEDINPREGSA